MLFCRDNEQLSKYGDTKSARGIMLAELKKLIEANPLFRDKLQFPTLKNSRLRTLINQRSLLILPFCCLSVLRSANCNKFLNLNLIITFFFSKLRMQFKLAAPAL